MMKNNKKAANSTSGGREKAFKSSTSKTASLSKRRSDGDDAGKRNYKSSSNNGEGTSFNKPNFHSDREKPQGNSRRSETEGGSRFAKPKTSEDRPRTFVKRDDGYHKSFSNTNDRSDRKPFHSDNNDRGGERRFGNRSNDDRPRSFEKRDDGFKKPFGRTDDRSDRKPFHSDNNDRGGERRFGNRSNDDRPRSFEKRDDGFKKPFGRTDDRSDRKPFYSDNNDRGGERHFGNRSNDDRPRSFEKREGGSERRFHSMPSEDRPNAYDKRESGRKPFERSNDRPARRPARRDITGNSEILTEIVASRRQTGRLTDKQKVLSLEKEEMNQPIRLNKYISNSGICSRRDADKLIESGAIMVNGVIINELGSKVFPTDEVRFEDRVLNREKPVYVLLNKPKDYITTIEDERGRKNVMELIDGACRERVYPVGRLDRNTTGLLLFTNDGEMAKKLTHPRFGIKKVYQVELDKNLSHNDMNTVAAGLEIDDTYIKPDEIAYINEDSKKMIGIEIHSGQNRIVRRIFETLGYDVIKLDRTYYAGLTKKDLPRGRWRILSKDEINMLKMSVS